MISVPVNPDFFAVLFNVTSSMAAFALIARYSLSTNPLKHALRQECLYFDSNNNLTSASLIFFFTFLLSVSIDISRTGLKMISSILPAKYRLALLNLCCKAGSPSVPLSFISRALSSTRNFSDIPAISSLVFFRISLKSERCCCCMPAE